MKIRVNPTSNSGEEIIAEVNHKSGAINMIITTRCYGQSSTSTEIYLGSSEVALNLAEALRGSCRIC